MTDTFSIKNFERFQHYRDRHPPWIKLYNELLDDYDFACLQDASKLHLILIWLLASRSNNILPFDSKWVAKRINATSTVDLSILCDAGFIIKNQSLPNVEQVASGVLADCEQNARPERERETEGETEGETEKVIVLNSDWPKDFRERFWEAYPRRVGKKAAIRKLEGVWREGEVGFAVLLSAVRAIDTKDPKFIPFPLTWLNQGRYLDHSPTQLSSSLPTKIFVEVDTPQWKAWAAHKPGGYPETDRRIDGGLTGQRGWFFDSEWPPEQQKQAEQQ